MGGTSGGLYAIALSGLSKGLVEAAKDKESEVATAEVWARGRGAFPSLLPKSDDCLTENGLPSRYEASLIANIKPPVTHSWLSTPSTATPAPAPLRARSSTPSRPSSSPSRPTRPGSRTRSRLRKKRPRQRATSMRKRAGPRTSTRTRFVRRACRMRALGACGSCSRVCRRRCEASSDLMSICTYYPYPASCGFCKMLSSTRRGTHRCSGGSVALYSKAACRTLLHAPSYFAAMSLS